MCGARSLLLSYMNLLFQGANNSITNLILKVQAFVWKLGIWMKNVESKYGMFKHLTTLPSQFFPQPETAQNLVDTLFSGQSMLF